MSRILVATLLIWAAAGCGGDSEPTTKAQQPDAGAQLCTADDSSGADSAYLLTPGEPASEYICTSNDSDWYRLEVPAATPIMRLVLSNQAARTPVLYRYALFDAAAAPLSGLEGQDPGGGRSRLQLEATHRLPGGGTYYIVIRDENGVDVDRFNAYTLLVELSADPDAAEPLDHEESRADARPLGEGPASGHLSFGGDVDWYVIEAGPEQLLQVTLEVPADATIRPRYRLYTADGETPFGGSRLPSGDAAASVRRVHHLPGAGRVLLELSDPDEAAADLRAAYTLEAVLVPEADPAEGAERNDSPGSAKELQDGATAHGARLASLGDVDWFRLQAAGGASLDNPRRLELQLVLSDVMQSMDGALLPTVSVLQAQQDSPCSEDSECALLSRPCAHDAHCPGALCSTDQGRCEGAGVCLPGGLCGALLWQTSVPLAAGGEPSELTVHTMLPLLASGELYVEVRDMQDDDHQPPLDRSSYQLTFRTHDEPDAGENDGVWFPWGSSDEGQARLISAERARDLGAPDIVRAEPAVEGQLGELLELRYPPVSGYISFAGDQDWYLIEVPEEVSDPSLDWQIIADYSHGGSPLSVAWTIYNGPGISTNAGWIGGVQDIPHEGVVGDDECAYLCHLRELPLWLRVSQDVPRTGWDGDHAYSLQLRLVPGCPSDLCPCEHACPAD